MSKEHRQTCKFQENTSENWNTDKNKVIKPDINYSRQKRYWKTMEWKE